MSDEFRLITDKYEVAEKVKSLEALTNYVDTKTDPINLQDWTAISMGSPMWIGITIRPKASKRTDEVGLICLGMTTTGPALLKKLETVKAQFDIGPDMHNPSFKRYWGKLYIERRKR